MYRNFNYKLTDQLKTQFFILKCEGIICTGYIKCENLKIQLLFSVANKNENPVAT